MLIGLLLAIALVNIALAFYTTLVFRRDHALVLAGALSRQEPAPAPQPIPLEASPAADEDSALPEQTDTPLSPASEESDSAEQIPLEELFYRVVQLLDDIAEIDQSVLKEQASEPSTEEKLPPRWPELAQSTAPIESLLAQVAETLQAETLHTSEATDSPSALMQTGTSLVEQCRDLAEEMETESDPEANQESGMHQLRDLFKVCCVLRNQCEDLLVQRLGIDHRLYRGRVAFREQASELLATSQDSPGVAVGLEIDHLAELNSMHGALAVNALLREVERTLEASLPESPLVGRLHGQCYLALLPGATETIATQADRLRRQLGTTTFYFEQQSMVITTSLAVVPLNNTADELPPRIMATLAEAKSRGYNQVLVDQAGECQTVESSEAEVESSEVVLSA